MVQERSDGELALGDLADHREAMIHGKS